MRASQLKTQKFLRWPRIAKIAIVGFFILTASGVGYGQNVFDSLEGKWVPATDVYSKTILGIDGLPADKDVIGVDTFLNGIPLSSDVLHKPGIFKEKRENAFKTVYWNIGVDLGFIAKDGENIVDYIGYLSDGNRINKRSIFNKDREKPDIKIMQSSGFQKSFWVRDNHGINTVRVQVYNNRQLHELKNVPVLMETPTSKFFVINHPAKEIVISASDQAGNYTQSTIGASFDEIIAKLDTPLDPDAITDSSSSEDNFGYEVRLLVFYDPNFETQANAVRKGTVTIADITSAGLIIRDAVNGKGYTAPLINKVNFDPATNAIPFDSTDPTKRPITYVVTPPGQINVPKFNADDPQLRKNLLTWAGQFKQDNNIVIVLVEDTEEKAHPKECGVAFTNDGITVIEVVGPGSGNCYANNTSVNVPSVARHEMVHLLGTLDHDISANNAKSIMHPNINKNQTELAKSQAMYLSARVLSPAATVKYPKMGISTYTPVNPAENRCGNGAAGFGEWCEGTELNGGTSDSCLNPNPRYSNPPNLDPSLKCNWLTGGTILTIESDCFCKSAGGGSGSGSVIRDVPPTPTNNSTPVDPPKTGGPNLGGPVTGPCVFDKASGQCKDNCSAPQQCDPTCTACVLKNDPPPCSMQGSTCQDNCTGNQICDSACTQCIPVPPGCAWDIEMTCWNISCPPGFECDLENCTDCIRSE